MNNKTYRMVMPSNFYPPRIPPTIPHFFTISTILVSSSLRAYPDPDPVIINCLTSSNSRPLQECSPHPEDASRRGEKL